VQDAADIAGRGARWVGLAGILDAPGTGLQEWGKPYRGYLSRCTRVLVVRYKSTNPGLVFKVIFRILVIPELSLIKK
jgi:hypothetical protein